MCKLQIPKNLTEFESHPLRQIRFFVFNDLYGSGCRRGQRGRFSLRSSPRGVRNQACFGHMGSRDGHVGAWLHPPRHTLKVLRITSRQRSKGEERAAPGSTLRDYSGVMRLLGTHRPGRRFNSCAAHQFSLRSTWCRPEHIRHAATRLRHETSGLDSFQALQSRGRPSSGAKSSSPRCLARSRCAATSVLARSRSARNRGSSRKAASMGSMAAIP